MIRCTRINWDNFIKLRNDDNKIEAAQCSSCKRIIRTCTEKRFQTHRNSCKGVENNLTEDELSEEEDICPVVNKRQRLENRVEITDEMVSADIDVQKTEIDKKLASFFIACNIPYNCVEDDYFRDFVDSLCKINFKYQPPCRQVLSSTCLDKVHHDIVAERKLMFKNTPSVLILDEWGNKSWNKKVIVSTMRNNNIPLTFLTFAETSLKEENGKSLSAMIDNSIEIGKNKYETDFYAVVIDDNSKIVPGERLAKTIENNNLWLSTCASNIGNLLIKKVVESTPKELIEKLRKLINEFRDPKLEKLLLRYGETKLKNYSEARNCNIRDMCKSVQDNLTSFQQIALLNDVTIDNNVMDIIFDDLFASQLDATIKTLDSICNIVDVCQEPTSNIADATELWLSLQQLPTIEYDQLIQSSIKQAIYPVGYAANILHHKYQGLQLNDEQRQIGEQFMNENLNDEGKIELTKYLANEITDTMKMHADKTEDPMVFWGLIVSDRVFPNLLRFATKCFLIPASTAPLEGLFAHRMNMLKNENASRLVDVYYTLKHDKIGYQKSKKRSRLLSLCK